MGATQTNKRYRLASPDAFTAAPQRKRTDQSRTTMRSITLRALAARGYPRSISSSTGSTTGYSSLASPHLTSAQCDQSDIYLSDYDYRKLSTLTGLPESKIDELHREFLILSCHGHLSYERFKSMLEHISLQYTSNQLEKLARQTFVLFDRDGNNYLDFAEFLAAYIIMEKDNLFTAEKPITVSRQPTTYYSPRRTAVNASPYLVNRRLEQQQQQQELVYVSPQYMFH